MKNHSRLVLLVITSMILMAGCGDDPTGPDCDNQVSTVEDQSFTVAVVPSIALVNGVGSISVRSGAVDNVRIVATKFAMSEADLDQIDVIMVEQDGQVQVTASQPTGLDNFSVEFEVTAPAASQLDLRTGVGIIDCESRPQEDSHFATGVGSVTLRLPADIEVTLELAVGVGSIDLEFPVNGEVSGNSVRGTIGSGSEATISANVGVGSIHLLRQPL